MTLEKYPVLTNIDHLTYEFISEGPRGAIKKIVMFQEVQENIFNLAFGDWDEVNQRIDDTTRSNNGDRDKVLATVAATVTEFINYYPDAIIVAEGVTAGKTRLYQIGIHKHWEEITQFFEIKGFRGGKWATFRSGENYETFAVKARRNS